MTVQSLPITGLEDANMRRRTREVINQIINEYLPSSSYTAADVLAKLLTVDGAGSGLDADLLDGHDSSYFARAEGALVYNSSNFVISNLTLTTLTWDSESYDTSSIHSTSSNTGRLTVPSSVTKARLSAQIAALTSVAANCEISLYLYKNGSATSLPGFRARQMMTSTVSGTPIVGFHTPPMIVSASDYFEIVVFQNSGGNVTFDSNQCWAAMEIAV
jgi:hypothetical protein